MVVAEQFFACVYLVGVSISIFLSCSLSLVSPFYSISVLLHHGHTPSFQTHIKVSPALRFRSCRGRAMPGRQQRACIK